MPSGRLVAGAAFPPAIPFRAKGDKVGEECQKVDLEGLVVGFDFSNRTLEGSAPREPPGNAV